jgi:hypothetical protein
MSCSMRPYETLDRIGDESSIGYTNDVTVIIPYAAAGGVTRLKMFGWGDQPVLQAYTEYQGRMIPMEIVEEMRLEQNASLEEWRGRNIAVSGSTWGVLTWYMESQGWDVS